ncbi:MAG: hypothetical protein JNM07_04830 [Phycisphaerae bacterium]|nr:hypothetical protein [Phycisphaerae bacterium]
MSARASSGAIASIVIVVSGTVASAAMIQRPTESSDLPVPRISLTDVSQSVSEPSTVSGGSNGTMSPRATFLLSKERLTGEGPFLWDGFLTGLRGFEHFYDPIGNPLFFESPLNSTGVRLLYLHHGFPTGSQIQGGDLNVYAAQARLALTERLAFIATKDGYSDLNAGLIPHDEGWNNIAFGAKYVLIADREADFVLTPGLRWELRNGDKGVLQGGVQELSPFLSIAKGFDRLHAIADVTGRIPTDHNDGNDIVQWDLHVDYELAPEVLPGLAPAFELHGLHYLSDGTRLPLSVGGLDYTNLGSTNVSGSAVVWAGVGGRWKLTPNMSIGGTYEFPLTKADNDIFLDRVTIDVMLTW